MTRKTLEEQTVEVTKLIEAIVITTIKANPESRDYYKSFSIHERRNEQSAAIMAMIHYINGLRQRQERSSTESTRKSCKRQWFLPRTKHRPPATRGEDAEGPETHFCSECRHADSVDQRIRKASPRG